MWSWLSLPGVGSLLPTAAHLLWLPDLQSLFTNVASLSLSTHSVCVPGFCETHCFPSTGVRDELNLSNIKVSRPHRELASCY